MELLKTPLERLNQERHLLTDFENEEKSFKIQQWNSTDTNELHLNFSLKIGTINFNGVLVYPELFPELPAYIRPQKTGERWSALHQYGGSGVLCLEYGPDNWNTNISGVDLVKSAQILLLTDAMTVLEMDVEPVLSRHSETIGQKLRGVSKKFIETPMLRQILLSSDSEKMDFKVAISSFRDKTVIVPTNIQNKPLSDIVPSFSNERIELSGWAIRIDFVSQLKKSVNDRVSLESFLGNLWPAQEEFTSSIQPILLYDLKGNSELFLINNTTPLFISYPAINLHDDQNQRLPSQFSYLSDTRIAIVGLGSLGSKIAISLARSGCKNFLLIDDDILAPHNLVRNEFNWLDVGFAKTYAVERALKRTALDMQVETYEMQIGGQENPHLNANIANAIGTCI